MSWDIWAEMDSGSGMVAVSDSINYTHNCNRMIRDAGFTEWGSELHGMPVPAFCDNLKFAISLLESDPEKYHAMNPPNGWGSYETLLPVLNNLLETMRPHTKAFVGASF